MTQPTSEILTYVSQNAKNPTTEFFKRIVRDSGIKLTMDDDPNIITQEQALVVRDMEKLLELEDPKECVQRFLKGFKVLIKKEKYLGKALLPTLFKKSSDQDNLETNVDIQQESLFRLFLKVNLLQREIIEILLNEITSTVSDEDDDPSRLRLLLSQLRYLPHIRDPENLTTKLLDIIDVAAYPSQLEILDSIPEILPDSEYTETAKELAKMLDKNEDLCGAIIDCLNALNSTPEIRAQIQDHILSKMLAGTGTKNFPVFLDFLMTDCRSRNLPATLLKIRGALNNVMASQDDKDKESSKILIFNRLQKAAASKAVCEGWLTAISTIKTNADHKPIDLAILFMLHSGTKLKKRTIETTFRRRIKDGHFGRALLESLLGKYLPQQLLRDYFATIVEVGSSLLRVSNDPVVVEFASALFELLFTHEHTDRIFRQEILENMVVLVGGSDQKNAAAILNVLVGLAGEIAKTPNHAAILMRLLEKLDSFELKDVRVVFEILCGLTCSDDSVHGLKEELHMIVRKHLSSSKRALKCRGIISAVVMTKYIATVREDRGGAAASGDSIVSINQLRGAAKEAAALLELTNTSTASCPELVGLYYDQLACMLNKCDSLDKNFLAWLFETITSDFTNIFITDSVCGDTDDLQFSMQFNLNSEEEVDSPIAVNIAEHTLKSEKSSILTLAPHFRLLRLLHYKQENGDLSSIDALLGCGVILPRLEQRDGLGIEQLKQMADCVFHCINWFREIISGFVSQSSRKLRYKIIQRLDNLNELEEILLELLQNIPDHKLPVSYFDATSQVTNQVTSPIKEPIKRPRKKLKTKTFVEETTVTATSSKTAKKAKDDYKISFRELDTDVAKLIKYPLNTPELNSSDRICLNINQLNFILNDWIEKLNLLTKGKDLGLSHLNVVDPTELITDSVKILPNVSKHFAEIIKKLDEEGDDMDNGNEDLQICFGLVLQSLSLIFSWSGFQHVKRLDLLRDILKAFRSQITTTSLNSVNHMITELIGRLADYTKYCSELDHGVNLIKTMEALYLLAPNTNIRTKIAKTAGRLLNIKWKNHNALNVDILVRSYLSSANIKNLCRIVGTLQELAPNLENKNDSLEMLESITKSNFYIFYRNLWTCLLDRVKTEIQSLTNSQHLTLWRTTSLTMQGLMTVVKSQESRNNLICFLKKSIGVLKIFLSQGIPILEIELKSEPDRVVEILKTIQSNTRFLHHLCCHSKLTKDVSLMSYVPQFRLTLESLIYRVKAALVANGCSEAFWMGNLKNRDLQGEDILTQTTNETTQEEGDDDELPSDESSDDEGSVHKGDKSGSEVFD